VELKRGLRIVAFGLGAVIASLGFLSDNWYRTDAGQHGELAWSLVLTLVVFGVAVSGMINYQSQVAGMVQLFIVISVDIFIAVDAWVTFSDGGVAFGRGSLIGIIGVAVLGGASLLQWFDDGT